MSGGGPEKKKRRARGFRSVRAKLTCFVAVLCAVLLALVWLLSVQLLEPMYNRRVREDLAKTADVYAGILERYGSLAGMTDSERREALSGVMKEILANQELLVDKCIDIAGADGQPLLVGHKLPAGRCLVHPERPSAEVWGETQLVTDSAAAYELRRAVRENEGLWCVLPDARFAPSLTDAAGTRQMAVGRSVGGRFTVIISTDLERVGEAAGVIRNQMPLIALLLLLVSVGGACLVSRWFTGPILALSDAARRVAKGDYTARVEPRSADELGALAGDFNTMAGEVGRTAELQRDLIANVSHDLRTPLTLIKGYAETVRDLTGDDAEKRTQQLSIIVDEADRLSALVSSVMELSKYSSGTQKPQLVSFDMAQLCDEVVCRYEDVCQKNGYTITLDAPDPCMVTADPDGMMRVVHNLLANAVHHIGPDGQIALRVHATAEGAVRVSVEDHGAGIAKEDLPYIFDKYYRARAEAGRQGTGLGLSITKAILISHGFAFGVDSTVGQGSTFWFAAK